MHTCTIPCAARDLQLAEKVAHPNFVQRADELIDGLAVLKGNYCWEGSDLDARYHTSIPSALWNADLELLSKRDTMFIFRIDFDEVRWAA
jgi:hypothetical protein